MTLQEKFEALAPERLERFTTVKTAEQLDAFIAESGLELTDEEREYVLAGIGTAGVTELSDDDLEATAGGFSFAGGLFRGLFPSWRFNQPTQAQTLPGLPNQPMQVQSLPNQPNQPMQVETLPNQQFPRQDTNVHNL